MATTDNGKTISGSAENDAINHSGSGAIDTTYDGKGSDDYIQGGKGSDTYIWRRGDSSDTIWETWGDGANTDTIRLEGLDRDDVTLGMGDQGLGNLIISIVRDAAGNPIEDPQQTLTVDAHFSGNPIERLVFGDDTVWDRDTINQHVLHGKTINGSAGGDYINHSGSGDIDTTYDGRGGDDDIRGGRGSDTYIWRRGDGNDVIEEEWEDTGSTDSIRLEGLNRDDVTVSYGGQYLRDLIISIVKDADGNPIETPRQTLTVYWHFAGHSVERLIFGDGTEWDRDTIRLHTARAIFEGTAADDVINHSRSGDFDTTYDGKGGDDRIMGGKGSDTYIWRRGDGSDRIEEVSGDNGNTDTIRLEGLNRDDVTVSYGGQYFQDMIITIVQDAAGNPIENPQQTLTVARHFAGSPIEGVVFDDTVWDRDTIDRHVLNGKTISGSAENDAINHSSSGAINTTYDGKGGDDDIRGGAGSDTYIWRYGDGSDTIYEVSGDNGNTDSIRLEGLERDDVTFRAAGRYFRDLIITIVRDADGNPIADPQQTLTVRGHFSGYSVERLVFGDGTVWDHDAINRHVLDGKTINGSAGRDYINHSGSGDFDTTYDGKGGYDEIYGGRGSDTYIWRRGDGSDTIREALGDGASTDSIRLEGLNQADVALSSDRNSRNLIITIVRDADGNPIEPPRQTLTVRGHFTGQSVERLIFEDETVWDYDDIRLHTEGLVFEGTAGDDAINHAFVGNIDTTYDGKGGDDSISGGKGSDTYIWRRGDGSDTIREAWGDGGSTDTIRLERLNRDDVTFRANEGSDLIITIVKDANGNPIANPRQTLTVHRHFAGHSVEKLIFGNGTVWDHDAINRHVLDGKTVNGTDRNDIISHYYSGAIGTTYDGEGGDDTIQGGEGSDTYIWRRGDGSDTIYEVWGDAAGTDSIRLEGLNRDDVTVSHGGLYSGALIITIVRDADGNPIATPRQTLTVGLHFAGSPIEGVVFDDTVWDRDTIDRHVLNGKTISGSAENDAINHSGSGAIDTTYDGKGGDDDIRGGEGSDTYIWRRGDGSDSIVEARGDAGNTDSIRLEGLNQADVALSSDRDSRALIITIVKDADGNPIANPRQTLTVYRHFTGSAIERLIFEDETVWDYDTIRLHTEGLVFEGTAGDDVINHGRSGAIDTTYDGKGGDDSINGGAGSDTYIWRRGDGSDTIYEVWGDAASTDSIRLEGLNRDDVTFETGGRYFDDLIITIVRDAAGNPIANPRQTLTVRAHLSYAPIERIVFDDAAWDGRDVINRHALHGKTINGSAGRDYIEHHYSGAIDTTYDGKGGDDNIQGGGGDDTYIWRRGDGSDTIKDTGGEDTLRITGVADKSEVWLSKAIDDLKIHLLGSADAVTVEDWFTGPANRIENIALDNGEVLLSTQVDRLVQAMAVFDVPAAGNIEPPREVQEQLQATIAAVWS